MANTKKNTSIMADASAVLESQGKKAKRNINAYFLVKAISKEQMENIAAQFDKAGLKVEVRETNDGYVFHVQGMKEGPTPTIDKAQRSERVPKTKGHWEPDDVKQERWVIDLEETPKVYPPKKKGTVINRSQWGHIVGRLDGKINSYREKHGLKPVPVTCGEIPFKDGYPDFESFSFGSVNVSIYSTDRTFNYAVANQLYGEQHDPKYSPEEVENWMEEHNMTWHETPDCQTMMKVPSMLHGNIPHNGGVNSAKRQGEDVEKVKGNVVWTNQKEVNSLGERVPRG